MNKKNVLQAKLLSLFLLLSVIFPPSVSNAAPYHKPYEKDHLNFIYNLMFCDDLALFKSGKTRKLSDWQRILFGQPNESQVRRLAKSGAESRIRLLAYNWLKNSNKQVDKNILLGVIIEVHLNQGLDVLASYKDGQVRYINASSKLAVVDGDAEIARLAKSVIASGKTTFRSLASWNKKRLSPPDRGHMRITFLASNGYYFTQAPIQEMEANPQTRPLIIKGVTLLNVLASKAAAGAR